MAIIYSQTIGQNIAERKSVEIEFFSLFCLQNPAKKEFHIYSLNHRKNNVEQQNSVKLKMLKTY